MPTGPSDPQDLRARTRRVIFDADTPAGRWFDVALLVLIVGSIVLVMFESVPRMRQDHGRLLFVLEAIVTGLFTLEYVARLWSAQDRVGYARSFFGVIDVAAILPVYLSLLVPGAQSLLMVRALRLLRVFRVFKMARWLGEANFLVDAMRSSARKITVFLLSVLLVNLIVGSLMYVIEGAANGFDSIFRGVYWSIVTMSTVGFGDITPQTPFGQVVASALMILGYSIIAVPTGIVSAEMVGMRRVNETASCPACSAAGHRLDARHCWNCGERLA